MYVFCSLFPLFTETRPNIRTDLALPYSQYSTTSRSSDVTKPSSTKSGGPNMKIKEQLPFLIRSNSRQAGLTKAEQEKPLTANHCIDRQASPPTQPTSPPSPPLSLPTDTHVYCGSSAFTLQHAHTCTDTKHYFEMHLCDVTCSVAVDSLLRYVSADSSVWILRFCPFALSEWQNEGKGDETRLISFRIPSSGGLGANVRIFTCYLVLYPTAPVQRSGLGGAIKTYGPER